MYRFFAPFQKIPPATIIISDARQVHHARDVLRIKRGEEVVVCDNSGNVYYCLVEKTGDMITLKIKERITAQKEKTQVTIACAIPKQSKMDDIVDKLTQLGVERIIPLETERGLVKFNKDKKALRKKRWEKIALNAAKQSQRSSLVSIDPITPVREALKVLKEFDLKIILTLNGKREFLKEIVERVKPKSAVVFIGPEGDFTAAEVALAIEEGCIPVTLGDLVLRVETAAVSVASFFRFSYLKA